MTQTLNYCDDSNIDDLKFNCNNDDSHDASNSVNDKANALQHKCGINAGR